MRTVFVDASYWVAAISPRDQLHIRADKVRKSLSSAKFITTESVLVEVLNYFSAHGANARQRAARVVKTLLRRQDVEIIAQTHDAFLAGINLYEARPDKEYSLTDCISMNLMRERAIKEVLTQDHHFEQEGFTILL